MSGAIENTSMSLYERLLISSPNYRSAPPVRATTEGYETAIEKWKTVFGGDESRLVIERTPTVSPQGVADESDGVNNNVVERQKPQWPPPSTRTASDFLEAARQQSAQRHPTRSISMQNTSLNVTRADSVHSDYRQPYGVPNTYSETRGLYPRLSLSSPLKQEFLSVNEGRRDRGASEPGEPLLREPPPPPQRPYTVEWIVNSPQRGQLNPETGVFESQSITPIPDFTTASQPSLFSVPREDRGRPQPSAAIAEVRSQTQPHRQIEHNTHELAFPADDDRMVDDDERLALAAGDGESGGDKHSVARILFMLDEFDERKKHKQERRSELAKIHKRFRAGAAAIEDDERNSALALQEAKMRRERQEKERIRQFEHHLQSIAQRLQDTINDESQYRSSLASEESSHANAILNFEAKCCSEDLKWAKTNYRERQNFDVVESEKRRLLNVAEDVEWHATAEEERNDFAIAEEKTSSRIERRLAEIRAGNPVEQRQAEEDAESFHRVEDIEIEEESEWRALVLMMMTSRPMLKEEFGHRRVSLGIYSDLPHDDVRRDRNEEEMSAYSRVPSQPSNRTSLVMQDTQTECSEPRSQSPVEPRQLECGRYLQELHMSQAARSGKAQYGYNRNGWRYTPVAPDPLRFAGVKDDNGKFLGASSPVVKNAVRQLLLPSSRGLQRGDSANRTSPGLPRGTVILSNQPHAPPELTKDDEEDMMGILRNIRKAKTFSWPRHHASVRDRPSFPQDEQWEIYRREAGPNMGNSKRYHDEIDEEARNGVNRDQS